MWVLFSQKSMANNSETKSTYLFDLYAILNIQNILMNVKLSALKPLSVEPDIELRVST